MPTILPLAPSATLAPDELLAPSSSTTYLDAPSGTLPLTGSTLESEARTYIDRPIGHIGGTTVVGGGVIVKVGGTSVNQEPQRKSRVYAQQAPPTLIHVEYRISHDAPTGHIPLSGVAGETFVPPPVFRVTAGRYQAEPTIQDVLAAQRRARRIIRQKVGT